MINELKNAIVVALQTIEGIRTCEEYAGQLEANYAGGELRGPAILLHFGEVKIIGFADGGSGLLLNQPISAFLIAAHGRSINERAQKVDALMETVLLKVHNNNFMEGVSGAVIDKAVPHYMLEGQHLSVREIRWTQQIPLVESEWDGSANVVTISFNDDVLVGDDNG